VQRGSVDLQHSSWQTRESDGRWPQRWRWRQAQVRHRGFAMVLPRLCLVAKGRKGGPPPSRFARLHGCCRQHAPIKTPCGRRGTAGRWNADRGFGFIRSRPLPPNTLAPAGPRWPRALAHKRRISLRIDADLHLLIGRRRAATIYSATSQALKTVRRPD
jgi:hypothetical protein